MDLRVLRYFVAVAEERHVRRAAERLHMTVTKLDGGIEKIPNSKIQGRYVCPNPGSNGIKIALKYIRGDSPLPPVECDGVPDPYLLNRRPMVWPIMAGW